MHQDKYASNQTPGLMRSRQVDTMTNISPKEMYHSCMGLGKLGLGTIGPQI